MLPINHILIKMWKHVTLDKKSRDNMSKKFLQILICAGLGLTLIGSGNKATAIDNCETVYKDCYTKLISTMKNKLCIGTESLLPSELPYTPPRHCFFRLNSLGSTHARNEFCSNFKKWGNLAVSTCQTNWDNEKQPRSICVAICKGVQGHSCAGNCPYE